jgi:hypothetical protein
MGRYLDICSEWEKRNLRSRTIDGHAVAEVLVETARMVIFRDDSGLLWRRIHSWGMTWPVEVKGKL